MHSAQGHQALCVCFHTTLMIVSSVRARSFLAVTRHTTTHHHPLFTQLPFARTMSTVQTTEATQEPKVLRSEPLSDQDAKWVGLRAIYWQDQTGKERKWESADRRTRKGDADAVAVCCIIQRPSTEPHILLVSQFRPPVNSNVVEMPAGLIDAGEEGDDGARRAALRELKEETGYGTDKEGGKIDVKLVSNLMVNDPGMSGANMKLCVVRIDLADDSPEPIAEPDEGEFIEKHLVPLHGLMDALLAFQKKGFAVDARLAHAAVGIELGLGRLGAGKD